MPARHDGVLSFIERHHRSAVFLILASFVGIYASLLVEMRHNARDNVKVGADNLIQSLENHIQQSIARYSESFDTLSLELASAKNNVLAGGHERVAIQAHSAAIRGMGDFFLFDASGSIQQRSSNADLHEALKHRDFLTFHAGNPSLDMRIGKAFYGRGAEDGALWISRRLNNPDGSFSGVIAGTLSMHVWQAAVSSYAIGPKSAINLFHTDGTLLARFPRNSDASGRNFTGTSNFDRFMLAREGSFIGRSAVDGEERTYDFRHVPETPLVLDVATSVSEIYAGWWRDATASGAIVLALMALAIGLQWLLTRELNLRKQSEARYRALSDVDGLTGLSNRRCFDEALDLEWRRVQRTTRPLSVLLLDVDHFKAFNDTYGHLAGDECLRKVARTIREAVGRAADLAARYGGEEFVVLLPETDAHGCTQVAERIRKAVAGLEIPHAGSAVLPFVTVSIGTATLSRTASTGTEPSGLVASADHALYRAKHNGRNRVEGREEASPAPRPPTLPDDAERAVAVESYRKAADTIGREAFDELASIAASALEAPLAFVTLVGESHHHFIGQHGGERPTIPREFSLCAHTIAETLPLVIPDARADHRFAANPFVVGDPDTRFYAGAPIVDPQSGLPLGAVCVVDPSVRAAITPNQARILGDLAALAQRRLAKALPDAPPARDADRSPPRRERA